MSALSPAMAALLARLADEDAGVPDTTTLPAAEGRALAARLNERWNRDLPPMALEEDLTLVGLPARHLVPEEDEGNGAILYIHGGGFSFCSKDTHEGAARALANACRAPVVTFDYSLAPEHPYPAGLEDCSRAWDSFRFMMADRRTAISGDSAGANLALALMLRAPEGGGLLPATALLFYGVYDDDFDSPSYIAHADGPGLTRGKMQRYLDWYVAPHRRPEAAALPLKATDAQLKALPPLYLSAAGLDPLRSDTERLAARLAALGRQEDRFDLYDGVVHGFMQMSAHLPEARAAFADAGAFFRTIAAK
ncbi:alpha/beta hydrolase [Acuticoccus mangrovi]|uniref:Alpha/beta hydrolase n=1 Tax=Acuticoccus mangrovi TaxID=2796142 RepID=A0A934IL52_9HYPH|nr:alpha/beta hydrolase [Acuticoccus mangrovi]MBJ3774308.1 alpha/beta hydrolase [Acuticoccus mangrovi]